MKYFRLGYDQTDEFRQLGLPTTVSGAPVNLRLFFLEDPLSIDQLIVPIINEGNHCQFTIAPIEIPVVSLPCFRIISEFCGEHVAGIPGRLSNGELINVLHVRCTIDCIDYDRSNLTFYPPDYPDASRANLPQYIMKLVLDQEKALGHHLFRVKHYAAALIMSGSLREALENANVKGISILAEV